MSDKELEIELKLPVGDKAALLAQLEQLGADFTGEVTQDDILFRCLAVDFEALDQALRLRIETKDGQTTSILTYKGTPHYTDDGHKVRDEFETAVTNPEMIQKILLATAFTQRPNERIFKTRRNYVLDDIDIAVDELKFGTFIELEGTSEAIRALRTKLELDNVEPVTRGYIFLQWDWEAEHGTGN